MNNQDKIAIIIGIGLNLLVASIVVIVFTNYIA